MNRTVIAASLLLSVATAVQGAADTKVNCAKGDSINAALAKLSKSGPNVVTVSGTCAEDIVIEGFDDLKLLAAPGAALTPATAASRTILLVNSSRQVVIDGFNVSITAGFTWVAEFNGSVGCVMKNLTITGGGGIRLQRNSYVSISDSSIHDPNIGIIVGNACVADIRGVVIVNTQMPTPRGQIGIAIFGGSSAFAEGVTISGFGQGVLAGGAFAVLGPGFFDTTRQVVIQGNRVGIAVNSGGFATLSGPTTITGNGALNNDLSGGVVVTNGMLAVTGPLPATGVTQIDNNVTQGVLVMNNGVAQITGAVSVSNNGYNGVAVINGGIGGFSGIGFPTANPTVTGNTARDIFCDSRSLVTGSASPVGADHRECANQIPGPALPMPRTP